MIKQPRRFSNLTISWGIYLFAFCHSLLILFYGQSEGLFPMPVEGTDQLSMLQAAAGIYRGEMPGPGYMYSPSYTLFLGLLVVVSGGNLLLMRIFQAALCALIPLLIYKLCLKLRIGRESALCGALLYCFYGPAQLIALDFLRAAPLGLCFVAMAYLLTEALLRRSPWRYFSAGICAGLCILGRENFIPVVFLPFVMMVFKTVRCRVRLAGGGLYIGALLLVLLPLMLFNQIRFGAFSIIPGHVANVMGAYHGSDASPAWGIIERIPGQAYKFMASYEIPNSLSFYAHRELIDYLQICVIPYNLLISLAALALFLRWRNKEVLFVGFLVAAYAGSMLFFEMFYRFRIPAVPLLAVLAACGLSALFKKGVISLKIAALLLALGIFVFTWQSADLLRPAGERRAVLRALIENGHIGKAERMILSLEKYDVPVSELKELLEREKNSSMSRDGF